MIITVPKIGDGLTLDTAFRPDTTETDWEIVGETKTTFDIKIPD